MEEEKKEDEFTGELNDLLKKGAVAKQAAVDSACMSILTKSYAAKGQRKKDLENLEKQMLSLNVDFEDKHIFVKIQQYRNAEKLAAQEKDFVSKEVEKEKAAAEAARLEAAEAKKARAQQRKKAAEDEANEEDVMGMEGLL